MKENVTHKIVTEQIVKWIEEKNNVPWNKPWSSAVGNHCNFYSKHVYQGINWILTNMSKFDCPYWATFKQINEHGGRVKKDEHGTIITFSKRVSYKKHNDVTGEDEIRAYSLPPLYFRVFNLEQTENIEWEKKEEREPKTQDEIDGVIKDYGDREGCTIKIMKSNRACYNVLSDKVVCPKASQYDSLGEYYATIFHELVHSTGHPKRLNRFKLDEPTYFGSESYSFEELVAEIGGCFIRHDLGIVHEVDYTNSKAYISSWLKKLKEDVTLVFKASSAATMASRLILNTKEKTNE